MWMAVRRIFRTAPVTASYIFVCSLLLAWVYYLSVSEQIGFGIAQGRLGSVTHYTFGSCSYYGPFDLWKGQWWRVIISGFHHGSGSIGMGLFHLVTNCLALWFLGGLLENRIGSLKMGLFTAVAIPVSMLPEYLAGHVAVGISGAICAIFGYLIVLRAHDRFVHEILTQSVVNFVLFWLLICIPLTYFDILPVANLAHFSGLFYGLLAGSVSHGRFPYFRTARALFFASHLLILVGFYYVQHPVWNGLYHWHASRSVTGDQKSMHLRSAVGENPHLEGAWVELSNERLLQRDWKNAWKIILLGVQNNRSGSRVINAAKLLGHQFQFQPQWGMARNILREVFDDEAPQWEKQFLAEAPSPMPPIPLESPFLQQLRNHTDRSIQLPEPFDEELRLPKQPQRLPPLDPDAVDSAVEGRTT